MSINDQRKMTDKEILAAILPFNLELTEDFVLVFPGSTKGGPGKSSTVITAAAAFKVLGLPVIVGTYDTTNDTLTKALGENVIRLNAETPESARRDLAAFKKACLAAGAIGMIDLPGAVNNQASSLIENIRRARIMEMGHLILISPVRPDRDEIEGAHNAITLFDPDSTLLRAWKPSNHSEDWESFEAWKFLKPLNIWPCENWTAAMKAVLTRSGAYGHLPTVPEIPQYLMENYDKLDDVPRLDIEDAVDHIHHMAKYLYHTVLRDITRPIQETGSVSVPAAPATTSAEPSEKAQSQKKAKV